MITAETMILRSLRLLGDKSPGGSLTSSEQTDYLYDLNSFLDSQSLDRLVIPYIKEVSIPLESSVGTYEISPRPLKIEQAWVRDSQDADTPVEVTTRRAYNTIPLKTVDGSYPKYVFLDDQMPTGFVKVFPEPQAGLTLYLMAWLPLRKFVDVDAPLLLPPGYQRFIEFNFAIDVAGGFTNVSQEVANGARESKALVKGFNRPKAYMQLDAGIVSGHTGNILTGP